ncbi:outer membrane beta-barrel protein [Seongchinamella unica]|nr:outer membrane beta-barrel protein [Seongchinamella unica]
MPRSRLVCCLFALCLPLLSQAEQEEFPPLVQAFFGSLMLDDQSGEWEDLEGNPVDISFPSAIPSGGVEAEYTYFVTDYFKWGLNSGGSIGWKNSDTRVSGTIGGDTGANIRFEFDNSLFLGELHLGGYVRGYMGPNVSLYAAAGPMIMYGQHRVEGDHIANGSDDLDYGKDKDSSFAFGFYGRTGIDYQYSPGQHVGLSLRYLNAEMDFEDTVGDLDIRGPQFVLTYSQAL